MIPGFSGHLISELFLESWLESSRSPERDSPQVRSAFIESRRTAALLGPASSVRALLELGAEPLVQALGFERITGVESTRDVLVASASGFGADVGIVVVRWGE